MVSRRIALNNVTVGKPADPVDRVQFALVNFPRYLGQQVGDRLLHGRLDLTIGDYKLILDSVGTLGTPDRREPPHSGYAVTQTGSLRKISGETFGIDEATAILKSLWWLFSLMRGSYSAPVTWIGECGDLPVWTHHSSWFLDAWYQGEHGLFPAGFVAMEDEDVVPALERAVTRISERLADPDWRDVLLTALQWYVTSNTGRSTGDLMLTQAGLELLAYAHQVIPGRLSPRGFDTLTASDKVGLMLSDLGLDLEVPPTLPNLAAYAKEAGINGPTAVTRFRNAVVHPPVRKRPQQTSDLRIVHDARELGLFYLEVALLRTIDYDALIQHRLHGWAMAKPHE